MTSSVGTQVLNIALDELITDPSQPRRAFPNDDIQRLADSIAVRGVLQPIRVRHDPQRGCFIIVIGECRWKAAKLAGLTHIPAILIEGEPSEADLLSDQIIENTARNSLRPLELGRALVKLRSLKRCTSQELAKELGISGGTITKCEALLTLPEEIQALVDEGRVSESAAYEISRIADTQGQYELAHAVAAGKLNRDQVADAVRSRVGKRNIVPKSGRITCKLNGISITVSSADALTFDSLLAALDHLKRQAKKLADEGGKEVAALSKVLRAS